MISTRTLADELGITHEQAFIAVEQVGLGGFTPTREYVDGFQVLEVREFVAEWVRDRVRRRQEARKVFASTPERFRDLTDTEAGRCGQVAPRHFPR